MSGKKRYSICLDMGSYMTKAGFSHEEHPRTFFPTMIGEIEGSDECYVGDAAYRYRNKLKEARYPIKNGVFLDNDNDIETFFNHIFYNELHVIPSDHRVLLSEAPCNSKTNREKLSSILFEGYSIQGFLMYPSSVLTLYSEGKKSGLVLDSGHGTTHVTPVIDGHSIKPAIRRTNLAGESVTEYFMDLVERRRGVTIPLELAKDIKERHGVVLNGEETDDELQRVVGVEEYTLPDGRRFRVKEEKYLAPDLLFRPSLIGSDEKGVHELVVDSILSCPSNCRRGMFGDVIITGGSTLFRGFDDRVRRYLQARANGEIEEEEEDDEFFGFHRHRRRRGNVGVRLVPSTLGQLSVWAGARVAAVERRRHFITKKLYEEFGFPYLHKKLGYL